MSRYWWVNQGQTYEIERNGGYLWAPVVNKAGHSLSHHTNVSLLKPGDVLIHYVNKAIRAIGVTSAHPEHAERPSDLPSDPWSRQGYLSRIKYHPLDEAIPLREIPTKTDSTGPFDSNGQVKQGYLFPLTEVYSKALFDRFQNRWPLAWYEGSLNDGNGWDDYVYWAKKFLAWPDFDKNERSYKLSLGNNLKALRDEWNTKGPEILPRLNKTLRPAEMNLTTWRTKDKLANWSKQAPETVSKILGFLWNPFPEPVAAINQFAHAMEAAIDVTPAEVTNLASVLLLAVDPTQYPPYKKMAFDFVYGLTGFPNPSGQDGYGATYEHALHFLDTSIKEAGQRGVALRDRLDAQAVMWCIAKYRRDVLSFWPEEDINNFLEYVSGKKKPLSSPEAPMIEVGANPLQQLADKLNVNLSFLSDIRALLEHKKQVIFYGPPGTGKTYIAKELASFFAPGKGRLTKVQFHPSYAYEDFIEGYRPQLAEDRLGFELIPGPLRRVAEAAEESGDLCLLLVDEINRGNIAKVFGELFYLLEYRDEALDLQYSREPFSLPKNLWIIGTMNTADRSIALVDAALRRRFHFVPFFPDEEPISQVLRKWLIRNKKELVWLADVVDRANAKLGNRQMAIGPSHFLRSDLTEEWVKLIWKHSILPYIEEQLFLGEDSKRSLAEFELEKLRSTPSESEPVL